MANFCLIDRGTSYLLPTSVDEWLFEDHLARFVMEIIDQLDIFPIKRQYTGNGSEAYHLRMMLALLSRSYATDTFFSRKIETAPTSRCLPVIWQANNIPTSIPSVRSGGVFWPRSGELFPSVLMIAAEMGSLKLGDALH